MNALANTGHGHVHQRPDGMKAKCGGPGLCAECTREQAALNAPERASTASAITDEQIEEGREAIDYLHRHGFRKCDIAACNCGSWHGGDASNRLSEISHALSGVGLSNRGKTLLQEIELLIEEHEAALNAAPTTQPAAKQGEMQDSIDAIWANAQRYAEEHAASLDPLRTYAAVDGAKRRKLAYEVALRQELRELAERASVEPSQPALSPLRPSQIEEAWIRSGGTMNAFAAMPFLYSFAHEVAATARASRTPAPAVPSQPTLKRTESLRMPDGRCGLCGGEWCVCGCQGWADRQAASTKAEGGATS